MLSRSGRSDLLTHGAAGTTYKVAKGSNRGGRTRLGMCDSWQTRMTAPGRTAVWSAGWPQGFSRAPDTAAIVAVGQVAPEGKH